VNKVRIVLIAVVTTVALAAAQDQDFSKVHI
jgi:hypothetical protein